MSEWFAYPDSGSLQHARMVGHEPLGGPLLSSSYPNHPRRNVGEYISLIPYKFYAYVSGGKNSVLDAAGIDRVPPDASVRLLIISQRNSNPAVLHMHDAEGRLCGMTEHASVDAAKLNAGAWFVGDTLEWRNFPDGITEPLFYAVRGLTEAAAQQAQ